MSLIFRVALTLALAPAAHAATFTVTRQDDPSPNGCTPGDCSLREAVLAANATTDADTILLGSGIYLLSRICLPDTGNCQDLDVTQPLTIRGLGPSVTSIHNGIPQSAALGQVRAHTRVLESTGVTLRLQRVSIRYGYLAEPAPPYSSGYGGCVKVNGGSLEATSVLIEGCQIFGIYGYGGSVSLASATATLTNTTLASNLASSGGGGLYAEWSSIGGRNVSIRDNFAEGGGGGAYLWQSSLSLGGGSSIVGNTAAGGGGIRASSVGGITLGGTGALAADRLRIEGNIATYDGGGIWVQSVNPIGTVGDHQLQYLTARGNDAGVNGGGLYLSVSGSSPVGSGTVAVRDAEFAENTAGVDGGGLAVSVGNMATDSELQRLTLWGNAAQGTGGGMRVSGPIAIRNVSSTGNGAVGGGSALRVLWLNTAEVSFFTSFGDVGEVVRVDNPTLFRASVFDGTCTGSLTDAGANFVRSGSSGCPGTSASSAQLALAFGSYGGGHPVVGITSASSVLRDAAAVSPGATDARNYLRVGMCDAGAFEFDGVPQPGGQCPCGLPSAPSR